MYGQPNYTLQSQTTSVRLFVRHKQRRGTIKISSALGGIKIGDNKQQGKCRKVVCATQTTAIL